MRFWSLKPRPVHRSIQRWMTAALLSGTAFALADAPTTQPTLETVADRKSVATADLDRSLASDWVVARLDRDQSLTAWGVPMTADQPSTAIVGCSSEYQFCMVTAGEVRQGDLTADTGHVIFWSPTTKPRVMEFSGRDLQRSMHGLGRDDLSEQLAGFTASQDRRRWWGLVRPIKVNIGQPVRAAIDDARKSYLMQPEVVRVRRAAATPSDLPSKTAHAMIGHLRAGKTAEVAQLLSPQLFLEAAKRNELSQMREGFAASLVSQSWTKQINTDSLRATSDPMKYWFSAGKQNFVMTLAPFDQAVFVKSIVAENQP